MCVIGGRSIVGPVRRIQMDSGPVEVCVPHGVMFDHGTQMLDALADHLGGDHDVVTCAQRAIFDLLEEPCPVPPAVAAPPERDAPLEIDADTRAALDRYWEPAS